MRVLGRALLLASACTLLGGCPPEDCDEPGVPVKLTAEREPSIGTFSGTFTWLQTGEETTLDVSIIPQKDVATTFCGRGSPLIEISATTLDGVLSEHGFWPQEITSRGTFHYGPPVVRPDLETLVAAGKLPDAPDLLSRTPMTELRFAASDDGTMEALLWVYGGADRLHVGMGTLTRQQVP